MQENCRAFVWIQATDECEDRLKSAALESFQVGGNVRRWTVNARPFPRKFIVGDRRVKQVHGGRRRGRGWHSAWGIVPVRSTGLPFLLLLLLLFHRLQGAPGDVLRRRREGSGAGAEGRRERRVTMRAQIDEPHGYASQSGDFAQKVIPLPAIRESEHVDRVLLHCT